MKSYRQDQGAAGKAMDRQMIRVELPSADAGVAAALRRAYAGAVPHQCEGDFDKLLRRIGSASRGRG
jgi:hypothetical protein